MQSEYGGYLIKWNDYGRMFEILKDGIEVKNHVETLENCKKWIDAKNKQKFKRIPILHKFNYNEERKPGEVTSIVEGKSVWISSGNERRKVDAYDVWLDTPKNRQALIDINNKRKQVINLKAEIEEIENSTERLTVEMMIDESTTEE